MQSLIRFGVMSMEIKDRIADMRDKLKRMKSQRGILTKVQIFKFQKTETGSYLVDAGEPCERL